MKSLRSGFLVLAASLLYSGASFAQQFNVLVFSKTAGWHHDSVNAGVTAIQRLGELHHFGVVWTENAPLVFKDEELKKFKAVIFLQTTGDILNEEQQAVFERYIRAGNGFVGVHSAADTEYDWPWYTKMVGHMFQAHPHIQSATLKVEERNFPGMERFQPRFLFTDEWYEFDAARSDSLKYLLSIDETTYQTTPKRRAAGASFHPLSWYHEYDGGRAFYTALGHMPRTYEDAQFLHHLYGGIYWAATGKTFKAE